MQFLKASFCLRTSFMEFPLKKWKILRHYVADRKAMPQEDGKTFPHFSILYLLPFFFSSLFVSLSSPILPSCIVLCNSQGCLPLSLFTSLSNQKVLTAAKWLPTNSYGLGQTTPLFSVLSIHPPLPRLPRSLILVKITVMPQQTKD